MGDRKEKEEKSFELMQLEKEQYELAEKYFNNKSNIKKLKKELGL